MDYLRRKRGLRVDVFEKNGDVYYRCSECGVNNGINQRLCCGIERPLAHNNGHTCRRSDFEVDKSRCLSCEADRYKENGLGPYVMFRINKRRRDGEGVLFSSEPLKKKRKKSAKRKRGNRGGRAGAAKKFNSIPLKSSNPSSSLLIQSAHETHAKYDLTPFMPQIDTHSVFLVNDYRSTVADLFADPGTVLATHYTHSDITMAGAIGVKWRIVKMHWVHGFQEHYRVVSNPATRSSCCLKEFEKGG